MINIITDLLNAYDNVGMTRIKSENTRLKITSKDLILYTEQTKYKDNDLILIRFQGRAPYRIKYTKQYIHLTPIDNCFICVRIPISEANFHILGKVIAVVNLNLDRYRQDILCEVTK